ncbi:MAG: hypothetical protein ACK47J_20565, partial [Pseudanabaena sp.]
FSGSSAAVTIAFTLDLTTIPMRSSNPIILSFALGSKLSTYYHEQKTSALAYNTDVFLYL